jgi:hypothetical protein
MAASPCLRDYDTDEGPMGISFGVVGSCETMGGTGGRDPLIVAVVAQWHGTELLPGMILGTYAPVLAWARI